jgi:acetyltransferase-like isoleucine patch superfamily enzyme
MLFRRKLTVATELCRGWLRGRQGVRVGRGVLIRVKHGAVCFSAGVQLRSGCRIAVIGHPKSPATLHVGPDVIIGDETRINVSQSVTIGAGTEISWLCQILDTDFHRVKEVGGHIRPHQAPVTIGEHVLIGTGAIILKGVTIGRGAVVAAGSVVSKDVHPNTVVAGNPAQPVRSISDWT